MSRLEQSYRNNIGKLYVYAAREWDYNDRQYKNVKALVMVVDVVKNGGWFHYVSDIIKRDIKMKNEGKQYTVSCKEFHRKALPAALSPWGDTENKEVA